MLLPWGERTYVMGIINVTPDSFAGDGVLDVNAAVERGLRLVDEGADILDVGGESTRPGAAPVAADDERRRVLPVIEALAARARVPISVDSSKAAVAEAALQAGASIVNDVMALRGDPAMASVVSRHAATVVLMHQRRAGSAAGHAAEHATDVVERIGAALEERVAAAQAAGITRDHIIVDPGIGFAKRLQTNLALLRRLRELKSRPGLADLPLLAGTSRKGFIGTVLGLPVEERLEGTLATLAIAVANGADVVRVHDVRAAVRCCRMADAIVRGHRAPRSG